MSVDVHQVCESCVACLSAEKATTTAAVHSCGRAIGMDFKELDISESGNRYALVFPDYLTKWLEVFPFVDRTARTVAACLVKLLSQHDAPAEIIHDRAPEFLLYVIQGTAALLEVANFRGTPSNRRFS